MLREDWVAEAARSDALSHSDVNLVDLFARRRGLATDWRVQEPCAPPSPSGRPVHSLLHSADQTHFDTEISGRPDLSLYASLRSTRLTARLLHVRGRQAPPGRGCSHPKVRTAARRGIAATRLVWSVGGEANLGGPASDRGCFSSHATAARGPCSQALQGGLQAIAQRGLHVLLPLLRHLCDPGRAAGVREQVPGTPPMLFVLSCLTSGASVGESSGIRGEGRPGVQGWLLPTRIPARGSPAALEQTHSSPKRLFADEDWGGVPDSERAPEPLPGVAAELPSSLPGRGVLGPAGPGQRG